MLDHEYELMETRLREERHTQCFFAFADTVAAINYQKTIKGDGWLGLRFQLSPEHTPNDLVVHVRLLDNDNRLQQQAVGILGVNMAYACFRYHATPEDLLISLMDNLRGRVMIDMVRLEGPDFQHVDNRLICLWMVKNGLSSIAIFGPDGRSLHAGEFLYKRPILIARGSYRPPTLVQEDMIRRSLDQFRQEPDVEADKAYFLTEIALDNLRSDGLLDERDFIDRVELLCALKQTVVLSNCAQHKNLISYFFDYKVRRIGLVMGARKLENIIRETHQNNPDNLLGAFGEVFLRNVRFYIYPAMPEGHTTLLTSKTIDLPRDLHFLYDYLLENQNIVDLASFNPDILHIYHKKVLYEIQHNQPGWEQKVPDGVAYLIKKKHLFGYQKG
jgi:hypothetical protein